MKKTMLQPRSMVYLLAVISVVYNLSAQISEEDNTDTKTSFFEVDKRLDKGGNFYLYMSTETWFKKIQTLIEPLKDMISMSLDSEDKKQQFEKSWAAVNKFFDDSGISNLSGVGISSLPRANGNYTNKIFYHRYQEKGEDLFWKLFGTQSQPIKGLNLMPKDTALASYGDFDLNLLWKWIDDLVQTCGLPDVESKFKEWKQQLLSKNINIDELIASTAGEFGFLITVDQGVQYPHKLPNETQISVPNIGVVTVVKTKNDSILQLVDRNLGENPNIIREDRDDFSMRTMPLPFPVPIKLRPSIGIYKDLLFIASNDDVIREVIDVYTGQKPGLTSVEEYKNLSQDLPSTGVGFSYISQKFNDTISQVISDGVLSKQDVKPQERAVTEAIMKLQYSTVMSAVMQVQDNGIYYVSNSNSSIGDVMLLQMIVVPGAILSGMALPALSKAREKARRINCAGNLKQIGLACLMYSGEHDGQFPDNLSPLGEFSYLNSSSTVWGCPSHPNPGTTVELSNYIYVGAGLVDNTENPQNTILAYDRPENHSHGWTNILFVDGHVQGVPTHDINQAAATNGWILRNSQ